MDYSVWCEKHLKIHTRSGKEFGCACPLPGHSDGDASFSINVATGKWKCFGKHNRGGTVKQLATLMAWPAPEMSEAPEHEVEEAITRYVPAARITAAEAELAKDKAAKAFLQSRGIAFKKAQALHIGMEADRLWIPIYDHEGACVNVRRYDWQKLHPKQKYLHFGPDFGQIRLWPYDVVVKHDSLVLFEGEMDCLLAQSLGISNAFTHTGGAGKWDHSFTRLLKGKTVQIVYDIDDAGRQGAAKLLPELWAGGVKASSVTLPVDGLPKNGDFTDYMRLHKFDVKVFKALLASTTPETKAVMVPLHSATSNDNYGKEVKLRAQVTGKDQLPYMTPAEVEIVCQPAEKGSCRDCPLKAQGGRAILEVPELAELTRLAVDTTNTSMDKEIREWAYVPARCPGCRAVVTRTRQMWSVVLGADIESEEGRNETYEGEDHKRHAITSQKMNTNGSYEVTALVARNPKNQRALLQITQAVSSKSSLDAFTVEGKERLLRLFQA